MVDCVVMTEKLGPEDEDRGRGAGGASPADAAGAGGDEAGLPDFEHSLAEVQEIIDRMESGEISLEKSLDHYTRGMRLIKHCNAVLERAEERFRKLTLDEQTGELEAEGEAGGDALTDEQ